MEGFHLVSDAALDDLCRQMNEALAKGRRFFVRYAPEMNGNFLVWAGAYNAGNWFPYGQQPIGFLNSWKRVVTHVRAATNNSDKVAFIWSPNSGNGYPFPGGKYSAVLGSEDYKIMDSNNNGTVDGTDDPYSVFYPGDEWVDWIGFSVYHFISKFLF